eukprot:TRINITY_DN19078_c0_g1_i1.p1 TRINITY_DN19078_c0_g1~~TRINITY_DN19078_c0_g1_i1.p1  ORF type:complete len:202 (+),score=25.86 TRINITY_DN19078_c0_g1_i1:70-675(+)
MIARNISRICYQSSYGVRRMKWTAFKDPIETRVKTPPEVNSMNYLVISGRISRAPEWYKEDGKDLLALGIRTTYSRMKKEIITENGIVKWSQYFIMGQLHRCVCGYKLLGEEKLNLENIYETFNKGDKVIVKGSLRYRALTDHVCNHEYTGIDILVTNLLLIDKGDGHFNDEVLYTEAGKKIDIGALNKGISISEIFEYRG